jgi:hypothetical protein
LFELVFQSLEHGLPVSRIFCRFLGIEADDVAPILHPDLFDLKILGYLLVTAGTSQDLLSDLPLSAQSASQNVLKLPVLQFLHRVLADHASISHPAYLSNIKTLSEAIHHRQQGLGVRKISGPQFATHWPPVAGQDRTDDYLQTIRSMILGVAKLPQTLAALALKIEAGGIEKGQGQVCKQIPAALKQRFFHHVFVVAKPTHGPVEVVQLQILRARNPHISPAFVRRPIRSRLKETMHHGKIDRPFHGKAEMTILQQLVQDPIQSDSLPQSAENQIRSDMLQSSGFQAPLSIPIDHLNLGREPTQRFQQGIYPPIGGQLIDAPEGRQDSLDSSFSFPAVFYNLQIAVRFLSFNPHKHAMAPFSLRHRNNAIINHINQYKYSIKLYFIGTAFYKKSNSETVISTTYNHFLSNDCRR